MSRCINIDWLELYCKESFDLYPCNAQFFREHGYMVRERDYGTRQYREMFVILDNHDMPFIEVRRNPVSGTDAKRVRGIFDPQSCHLRLSNRYCYADNAVTLLSEFLAKFDYTVVRIFRLDLCMDFEKFDKGDDPQKILKRYMEGKYTKINQSNVAAHGEDTWEQRNWNSLSWGAPTSMVSTKFYNKTLELKSCKDKPYIRYAWFCAGLVDDFQTLSKKGEGGKTYFPDIWRVEFSIRSSAASWYIVQDNNHKKPADVRIEHSLATYATKDAQIKAFASLAYHYFHFKYYQEGVRKDRCPDKVLFDFKDHTVYKLDRLLADRPKDRAVDALSRRLSLFRMQHPDIEVRNACQIIIDFIQQLKLKHTLPDPYDRSELHLLQLLIARRIDLGKQESITDSVAAIESVLKLPDAIF